jgi:hypothetical protein
VPAHTRQHSEEQLKIFAFAALLAILASSSLVHASMISTSLGNTSPSFADGSHPTTAMVLAAQTSSLAAFHAICGSDTGSNGSTNCSASWTFNYSIPLGQSIDEATLTLGIWDIDSAATGLQVASYTLSGGDDLTALLNTVSEGLNGGSGALNSEYDVLAITIPSTSFGVLSGGAATISLALQGPGLGILGNTPTSNGAGLVFSTLSLDTTSPVPEPSFVTFVPLALGAFAFIRRRRPQ